MLFMECSGSAALLHQLSVSQGRKPRLPLKKPLEIGGVSDTYPLGDLGHRQLGGTEEILGFIYAPGDKVLLEGHPLLGREQVGEIILADITV